MNNLAVLYGIEGRVEEQSYWQDRVARYRDSNPYYHAWLGDEAAQEQKWRQAVMHYQQALALLPQDSSLLYALGMSYSGLGELDVASGYIERAIEFATLYSDIKAYELQLDLLQRQLVARM